MGAKNRRILIKLNGDTLVLSAVYVVFEQGTDCVRLRWRFCSSTR